MLPCTSNPLIHLSNPTFQNFSFHSLSLPLKKPEKTNQVKMATSRLPLFFTLSLLYLCNMLSFPMAKPANFGRDFRVTWAGSHITELNNGTSLQLLLDQFSGCGFASKNKFMFGRVSMKIKLIAGDSAGTVTAFYLSSETDKVRDELDFEFLGNRSGHPYTVQTNVYSHGKGDREQRVNLWFDPSSDFHTYSILWNHHHIVFFVDAVPIRVYKNNEAKGVPYPNAQPMGIYSTIWNADDWATRGGLEKIDWSRAPFYAYYKDIDIEACSTSEWQSHCSTTASNWWDTPSYQQLGPVQARLYRWVRMNHIVYDYCSDKSRYPVPPTECLAGI
ncbi:Xyloglucan endotransglucosylase/hydrolase [Rhynchospora pubera]|uniref:Xyloglucan endotransglucosylase/hydrolase n=1 Tax=Rhynchospora pubera TaxID=906938 RepID=A0AAV8HDE7_9POAL|nr:Xyloglucan endotransglucosylase/hydrolase [Rhynchospora pubera]